ncbi:class II aldolase/adducin family protein [Caenimonas sp. DR4.4]|uniref:Class II aldolase/adducin family protein n=2 Tax=Caenimonas aquaedulcis TaxID=2793270 RepID=A0A931H936_9BURK|nr:class II aldolase/adducin family protein [Caenimonas aquaedulcis]
MVAPGDVQATPVRQRVSEAEWKLRVDLAACYRLMDMFGMTDMIYNHISARLADEPEHLLINAYGLHYSEITASNLHKINHDGEIVERGDTHYGINHAGFVIHGAIHASRRDVQCVIHTHTRAGIAVSAMEEGLLPLSLHAIRFTGNVGYHDCEGTVVDLSERERIVRDLGAKDLLVLRNHGLLTCGASIPETFNTMYMLEQACRVQVDVMAAGAQVRLASQDAQAATAHLFKPSVRRPYGVMEWEALTRLLDRQDPSYRS